MKVEWFPPVAVHVLYQWNFTQSRSPCTTTEHCLLLLLGYDKDCAGTWLASHLQCLVHGADNGVLPTQEEGRQTGADGRSLSHQHMYVGTALREVLRVTPLYNPYIPASHNDLNATLLT